MYVYSLWDCVSVCINTQTHVQFMICTCSNQVDRLLTANVCGCVCVLRGK